MFTAKPPITTSEAKDNPAYLASAKDRDNGTKSEYSLAHSQDAYDRFAALVELPLTVLALLWLPVLVLPYIVSLPPDVNDTFEAIDLLRLGGIRPRIPGEAVPVAEPPVLCSTPS